MEEVEEDGGGLVVDVFFLAMAAFFPVNLNFEYQAALLCLQVAEQPVEPDLQSPTRGVFSPFLVFMGVAPSNYLGDELMWIGAV